MSTKPHDSTTCTAGVDGQPCQMCRFAEESARNRPQSPSLTYYGHPRLDAGHAGFLESGAENASETILTQSSPIPAPATTPDFTREWDTAPRGMTNYIEQDKLHAVLFDVIDGGCTCGTGQRHPWNLDDDPNDAYVTEDVVNLQRQRFIDEVTSRLRTDPRTAEFWFLRGGQQKQRQLLATMNSDLREMQRVARERITR